MAMFQEVTFITTIISDFGIIQASDSNLTREGSGEAIPGKKVFDLEFGNAALAFAGTYSVGSEWMDSWMPECIHTYSAMVNPTVKGFSHYLKARLEAELNDDQREQPMLFHIAGYENGRDGIHPVLYFVRNSHSLNRLTGNYIDIRPFFAISEDFWTRDYPPTKDSKGSRQQLYFNGTPDGRIAFVRFGQMFFNYLDEVWRQPQWKFRPPRSLDEYASIVDLEIRTLGSLYRMSDYEAPYIGGEVQIIKILPPINAITLWRV